MSDSICVIHSSKKLRDSARRDLEAAGYYVASTGEVGTAIARIETAAPSLILLEWLGLTDTESAIREIKSGTDTRTTRIIVIAEEDAIGNAIGALEYGADDCVATPCTAEELIGRVNACLRRPPAVSRHDRVRAGPLLLDRVEHRLFVRDDCVQLAPTEFRLIEFFIEHSGRAFSRQELLQRAWPRHVKAGRRTVDVNVRRLRQALEPFGCDHLIQTVRGYGYRFSLEDRAISSHRVVARPALSPSS
jgi:two-component system phosphate regulon response regulator PhoB